MLLRIYFLSAALFCSLTFTAQVNSDSCKIEVPGVFKPDDSGRICLGKSISYCDLTKFEFSIFDRWGQRLYETKDKNEVNGLKWDLKKVKEGTYYWILEYTIRGEKEKSKEGYSSYVK